MGTDLIRQALIAGGVVPGRVTLDYVAGSDGGNILTFDGTLNGKSVRFTSRAPVRGDIVEHARTAASLLKAVSEDPSVKPGQITPAAIDRLADRVAAAVPIAKAIIDGKQAMSALAKLTGLADRAAQFHERLGADADAVTARYDALEQRRDSVLAKHTADLDAAEAALDRLLNPLT